MSPKDSYQAIRKELDKKAITPNQARVRFLNLITEYSLEKTTAMEQYINKQVNLAGQNLQKGMEHEKAGRVDEAIKTFEQSIAENFDGNYPYDRLAIIYRKRGQYDDEIRVLEKAIWVFENVANKQRADVSRKTLKFKARLNKAKGMKAKKLG